MSLHVMVIGLNHMTAPVEIRERITFARDIDGSITRSLLNLEGVEEAVVLSTCNRAEVIVMTVDLENAADRILRVVGEAHGLDVEPYREFFYVKGAADAVRHVFRVTASLDSMVLGEPQILGQVKDSYRHSTLLNASGPLLNRLMHRAFFTAKRVRNETGVGKAAISVAYVAVELARKILGELTDKRVLLIGAGEMAELAARHLMSQVNRPVTIINRTYDTACALAVQLCGNAISMEELDIGLAEADVVITSTGSREPIIQPDQMMVAMRRRRNRPVFIIDIAIPRDVDPEVNDIDGVYLYNIDDLQSVAQENLGERQQEALKAEKIVNEEVAKFMAWTRSLDAAPTIVALKDKLEEIRLHELARLNGKLSALSPGEREAVEVITRSIINKIAHDPISFLRKSGISSKRNVYLDVVQKLFRLNGALPAELSHHGSETEEE